MRGRAWVRRSRCVGIRLDGVRGRAWVRRSRCVGLGLDSLDSLGGMASVFRSGGWVRFHG